MRPTPPIPPLTAALRPTPASPRPASPAICSAPPCRLEGTTLVVPPFAIRLNRQRYLSPAEIRIALDAVAPGRYRVVAVHNFHVEDRNPCLDDCVAGVFLAGLREDGGWEQPERFPVECRALQVLAEIRTSADGPTTVLGPP